jgi:hypothetical protein
MLSKPIERGISTISLHFSYGFLQFNPCIERLIAALFKPAIDLATVTSS